MNRELFQTLLREPIVGCHGTPENLRIGRIADRSVARRGTAFLEEECACA